MKSWRNKIVNQKKFYGVYSGEMDEVLDVKKWGMSWIFGMEELLLSLRIARKIKMEMKKVIKRNYSKNCLVQIKENKASNEIFNEHWCQCMGMCEGEVEESKVLTELVYSFNSSMKKVDWTKDLTEELNSKKLEVKRNLNEWKKKGYIGEAEEKKIWGEGKLNLMSTEVKKGQKISMMMIKNFTTSSKNAIKVVEERELKEWPVRKGINLHKNTLIFLLEGSESFRRVMWFLVLAYKMDEVNQKYIEELKKRKRVR